MNPWPQIRMNDFVSWSLTHSIHSYVLHYLWRSEEKKRHLHSEQNFQLTYLYLFLLETCRVLMSIMLCGSWTGLCFSEPANCGVAGWLFLAALNLTI
ncbi:hypothetical protein AQUCO_00700312v1 [Aquilegia coerulea]|uniref:Uncharacterized protein n=1 Tax=Aquilegia coerulea TaxID=218851 RepID=A0A2G5EJG0_AQUCA|nr:hypothetical protein AQUCO_00700312v1 [Aquilegia coerulea]